MKKIILAILTLSIGFTACDSLKPGAGKVTEGKISYKIDLSETEMDFMQKQLLQAAKLDMSFKGPFVKTEFELGMGMMGTTLIANADTKTGLMLFNMMGNKTAVRMTEEEMKEKENAKGKYTVELSDETKEIAGYKCKKAIIKMEDGNNLTMFYTEDVLPQNRNTEYSFSEIQGFPLEMQMNMNGVVLTMIASSVDGTPIPDDNFKMEIPEGYNETNMTEFKRSMGGAQ